MKLADTFDGIDPSGKPVLSAERTTVSDPEERQRIQQFLDGGGLVIGARRRSVDLVDPDRGRAVPMIFHTDGEWIWPRAIGYYLLEHDVPVQTNFLQHVRNCGYVATIPDMSATKRAIAILNEISRSGR